MASSATAPPVDPAVWIFGISAVRKVQRAAPLPLLAADGEVEAVEGLAGAGTVDAAGGGLAGAGTVDAAGGGLPVGAEAVALPPQAAVSRLIASTSARVRLFTSSPGCVTDELAERTRIGSIAPGSGNPESRRSPWREVACGLPAHYDLS